MDGSGEHFDRIVADQLERQRRATEPHMQRLREEWQFPLIVKISAALAPGRPPEAVVYDAGAGVMMTLPATIDLSEALDGAATKFYRCRRDGAALELGPEVRDQRW